MTEVQAVKKEKNKLLNNPPQRSLLEEIGNSITHGVGATLSIVALVLMLINSHSAMAAVASSIYGLCLFITMLMSCLYHAFPRGSGVKRLWRRFDYSSIYLLIGGTFTPLYLIDMGGKLGITLFIIQWSLILVGITMVSIFGPGRLKWLNFPLYFTLGWVGGITFIPRWIGTQMNLLIWILIGGLCYTLGMIPFCKRVKASHFIWHFFVLFGATIQWLGIFLNLYL